MLDAYIRQYGRRLYGLCLTLCGSVQEAEDLYQDTWLKVLRYFSKYDSQKPFEPWLTKICVNTYRNRLRRLARSPILSFSSTEALENVLSSIPAPEQESYAALYVAIDRLPERLRITVILFYFREMDVGETANVLGIPPGTVKSRLSKARRKLKEVLLHEDDLQF